MMPVKLYAKSAKNGVQITLPKHTSDVLHVAEKLLDATGNLQLRALGLEPSHSLERFRRDLSMAALLHDAGKANSYFQDMIRPGNKVVRQPIRHEAVSFWISRQPRMREWIAGAIDDPIAVEWVLWAVAGHHRKFPPERSGECEPMEVYFGHEDFHATLALGADRFRFPIPPKLENGTILFTPPRKRVGLEFDEACEAAGKIFEQFVKNDPESRRYVAMLKACLIAADVAGSIRRRGEQSMADWIGEAFANVPTVEQLDGIVRVKLEKIKPSDPERDRFRDAVSASTERVALVSAGCGSGKTLAAYQWAARKAESLRRNLRVFFCYPTTGTSSEGYRDYLKDVDLDKALIHGRADIDMELLGLGDNERDEPNSDEADRATADTAGALEHWSTPLVSCTVDTVLGLLQNNRRGVYLWPSIAGSAIVFDEIHSYDDNLFGAFLRFLAEMRGIPCLLMTASLPEARLLRIKDALSGVGEPLGTIFGPEKHEKIERYRQVQADSPWDIVRDSLSKSGKVLWVVNTVNAAMDLHASPQAREAGALIYHSRFKYIDRVERHKDVIEAFRDEKMSSALAFCTQVAEMSLDLSANLLVTQLAPIPSLIQRLGRLNRRAKKHNPWPFIVIDIEPGKEAPYDAATLKEARDWLKELGDGPLSQRDLVEKWMPKPEVSTKPIACTWFDGGFETRPGSLREGSPGIEIILDEDEDKVRDRVDKPEEVLIPMTMPKDPDWRKWQEVGFCKVPPKDAIDYDKRRGARWIR